MNAQETMTGILHSNRVCRRLSRLCYPGLFRLISLIADQVGNMQQYGCAIGRGLKNQSFD